MVMRFRYTSTQGRDVEVPDLDGLRAHVASGRVSAQTLLFDALTGDSGPATSHEAYRFVLEVVSEKERPARDDDFPDMEVTLTEPAPQSTAEVVERLRREREAEEERHSTGERPSPLLVDGSATFDLGDEHGAAEAPAPAASPSGEAVSDRFARSSAGDPIPARPGSVPPAPADGDPIAVPDWVAPVPGLTTSLPLVEVTGHGGGPRGRPRRARRRPDRLRRGPRKVGPLPLPAFGGERAFYAAGLVAVLGLAAVYLALDGETGAVDPAVPAASAAVGTTPRGLAPRGVADRLGDSEGIAFQHMVEGMDSLARVHRVFDVPAVWLEGRYLANAAAHAEVERYWERYLRFVQELRSEDEALFRRSFLARMESLDVASTVVSLRLAQALGRFEASQPLREGMYDRMEDLARAGLELHDLMVRRAVDIRYTPAGRVSTVRDPFLEIHATDEELQEGIYALMDRIFEDIEALHGQTRWTRDGLNDGVLESIRATGQRGTDDAP